MVEKTILSFLLYVMLSVGVVWALVTFWYPIHTHVMESNTHLYASVGAPQTKKVDVTQNLPFSTQADKYLFINPDAKEITLHDESGVVDSFSLRHIPEFDLQSTTPNQMFTVDKKTALESSTITMIRFPSFVRFGDKYVLHGPPSDQEGMDIEEAHASSQIELDAESALSIFHFVEVGMPVYVATPSATVSMLKHDLTPLMRTNLPATSALAYGVSDVETGEVFLIKGGNDRYPVASITKLVTAAVATDVVGHGAPVAVSTGEVFTLSDLYYPLLLRSDNIIAERIAGQAGRNYFLNNMNAYVRALGMKESSFADASGLSPKNLSTVNDLILFTRHLYNEKKFLLDISRSEDITITSERGKAWHMENQNSFAHDVYFRGGKLGYTDEAGQTSLAIFDVPINGTIRSVAVIVLRSKDWKQDTRTLLRWLISNTT